MTEKDNYTASNEIIELYLNNKAIYEEGCPEFMNTARHRSFEKFQYHGIPSRKNESYKYTDLRPVFQNDFQVLPRYVNHSVDLHSIFRCNVPQLNTHLVLLINGWYYRKNQKIDQLPDGVIVGSLNQIANEHPQLIDNYYNQLAGESSDPIANLNTTLAKDGLFFFIPDNTIIEKPVQIINLMFSPSNTFANQRNLFIIGKNSEATVVLCDHTLNHNYYILNNVSECYLNSDARFNFCTIQNQHNGAVNLTHFFSSLSTNSQLNTNALILNGGLVRNTHNIVLNSEHAQANLHGLALADENQHVDNSVVVEHRFPNGTSNQRYKYILDEQSSGSFTGQIHVFPDAQKTEAYQKNNNILLSDQAEMNTKPLLIIHADDVRCSHGATVGIIDEDALFYLRTRGIGEEEARLMILYAFADEIIAEINVPVLRERMEELVDKRLRGELSPCQRCALTCAHEPLSRSS